MAKFFTKTKLIAVCALLALCVGFTAIGLTSANPLGAAAEETAQSAWQYAGPAASTKQYDDTTKLTYSTGAAIMANTTNLLEQPNRTVTFNIRVNTSDGWGGIGFLNGLENGGKTWSNFIWPGIDSGADIDPYYHLIWQSGAGQLYNAPVKGGALCGVGNVPTTKWIGVEVHIGTGTDGDYSYIKMNNKLLTQDSSTNSAFAGMTADMFPKGCYLAMHYNLLTPFEIFVSEFGCPIITTHTYTLTTVNLYKDVPISKNMTFTVRQLTGDLDNLTVYMNGTQIDSKYLTIAEVSGDSTARKITLNKSYYQEAEGLWDLLDLISYLSVKTTDGRVAALDVRVVFGPPPVWTNGDYVEIDEIADLDMPFTSVSSTLTAADIKLYSGVYNKTVDRDNALVADVDYTLAKGTQNDDADATWNYTLTIKKEYLEKNLSVYRGRMFEMEINRSTVTASVYYRSQEEGWVLRSVDYVDGTNPVSDEYYTTVQVRRFAEAALSSRMYYNEGFDVTKPIVVEFKALPSAVTWMMLNVSGTLREMDYYSDGQKDTSALQALFFGEGRSDIQKLLGFEATASTNANYDMSTMKNIVVEIYFGADAEDAGYFRINGADCGAPTAKQSDFAEGVAYVGFFFNNQKGNFEFTANTHVNAVAVLSPVKDSEYTMDLSSATDFAVTLGNTTGNLTVKDDKGNTLVKDTDYTYEADTGVLTLKAGYFSKLPFSKDGTVSVWDNGSETGTQFKMSYFSSKMQSALISFATKDQIADTAFTMPSAVTEVSGIASGDIALDAALYSFANGVLTIKKDAIANITGAQEFIVTANGAFYPCYVYVQAFENGGYKTGEGTVAEDEGLYTIAGAVNYQLMKSYDLTAGLTLRANFKTIAQYYENGLNADGTTITFKFYDPYTAYTLQFVLYANYADDKISETNAALYGSYAIYDANGGRIVAPVSRGISLSQDPNNQSASGIHGIKFSSTGSNLVITVDTARNITINNLQGFNLSACILSIETTAGSGFGVNVYDGIVDIAYSDDVAVTGITLNQTTASVAVGGTVSLTATVTPEDATDKTVRWASSDETIATVDENGKVTALKEGTVTITATCGDQSATCTVTVTGAGTDPGTEPGGCNSSVGGGMALGALLLALGAVLVIRRKRA